MPLEIALPCVRCQALAGYRIPDGEARYKYRCPKCRQVYEARLYDLLRIDVLREGSAGLLDLVAPSLTTMTSYKLKVRDRILGTDQKVQVQPFRNNPPGELFSGSSTVALVYVDESMVAASNPETREWLTTMGGAWLRGKAALGFGSSSKEKGSR